MPLIGLCQAFVVFGVSLFDSTVIAAVISGGFLFANTLLTELLVRRERRWQERHPRRRRRRNRNDEHTPHDSA